MLRYASWRGVAALALVGMFCLSAASPVSGQGLSAATGLNPVSENDFLLAAQPDADAEGAAPLPKAAPAPPAKKPAPAPPLATPPARTPTRASQSRTTRLAGLPNMFGDAYGYKLQVCDFAGCGLVDIPPPGGTRRMKITENDKALPVDRVFFIYNHFENAVEASINGLGVRSFPIDRYTLGLEKTFRDGLWSVELRMPFSSTPDVVGSNLIVGSGNVGNLAVTLKRLLYVSRTTAVGAGLVIDTPTGEDAVGQGLNSTYRLSNDAVHLAPFIGYLHEPNGRFFSEGFLQLDFAANDNRISFGANELGRLPEQDLFFVDFALGYWLHRDPCARRVTGMAAMVEYHYTTTIEDAQLVSGTDGFQILQFGNIDNRLDISNVTVGLHTELGLTTVRIGGVFPLGGGSNRLYDAEVQVSVNRRF